MQVFYEAGFKDVASEKTDKSTYVFKSRTGSLDHVLALDSSGGSGAQAELPSSSFDAITGADVWNINSVEALALEYSRFNYNAGDFYAPDQFRASDHDPVVVGLFEPEDTDGTEEAGVDGGEAEADGTEADAEAGAGANSDASVSADSDSSDTADSSSNADAVNADAASDSASSDSSSGSNSSSTAGADAGGSSDSAAGSGGSEDDAGSDSNAGGDLPRTGVDPTLMMSIAAGLLVIGASIVVIVRRRKLGGRS